MNKSEFQKVATLNKILFALKTVKMQQSLLSSNSGSEHEDKQRADEMTINMFYFEL